MTIILDFANDTRGYLLGRLLCLLERIEQYSIVEGISDGVGGSLYCRALAQPSEVFPCLLKHKGQVLAKIKNSNKLSLNREIVRILSLLENFPDQLTAQDQARFALGYHHQRQSLAIRSRPKPLACIMNVFSLR